MGERWKPGKGEVYYCIFANGNIDRAVWKDFSSEKGLFEHGNCFKTEAEAKAAEKKLKALLLSLHTTQDTTQDEQLPDWCKVGEWVYHDSDGYYYTVKSIDIENDNIQITDEESEYTYTANEIKTFFSEARLRPYNADEMKALVGKVLESKEEAHLIYAFDKTTEKIETPYAFFDAQLLLDGSFTINNKPCGVLEHLENGEWVE